MGAPAFLPLRRVRRNPRLPDEQGCRLLRRSAPAPANSAFSLFSGDSPLPSSPQGLRLAVEFQPRLLPSSCGQPLLPIRKRQPPSFAESLSNCHGSLCNNSEQPRLTPKISSLLQAMLFSVYFFFQITAEGGGVCSICFVLY